MICKQFNCIFIHIPKVAGQSVEQFFLHLTGLTWKTRSTFLLRRNLNPVLGPRRLAHLTAAEYVSCGYLTAAAFNSFYKFAFVRNPWDRIVSEYMYRRHHRKFDFKSFLFNRLPPPGPSDGYRHILPQHCFLYDKSEKPMVDFIGRFENLQADFELVCKHLGINSAKLPHRNKSSIRKGYVDFYDSESKEFVAELYKKDIRLFNYTFDV